MINRAHGDRAACCPCGRRDSGNCASRPLASPGGEAPERSEGDEVFNLSPNRRGNPSFRRGAVPAPPFPPRGKQVGYVPLLASACSWNLTFYTFASSIAIRRSPFLCWEGYDPSAAPQDDNRTIRMTIELCAQPSLYVILRNHPVSF